MVAVFYSAKEFLKLQVLHDAKRTIILWYLCNFQSFLTISGATFICQLLSSVCYFHFCATFIFVLLSFLCYFHLCATFICVLLLSVSWWPTFNSACCLSASCPSIVWCNLHSAFLEVVSEGEFLFRDHSKYKSILVQKCF